MPCNGIFRACLVGMLLVWATRATLVAAGAAELTFDFHIERGRVMESAQVIRIKQGDAVRLRWHADRSIILHLHGYDLEKKIEPGTIGLMEFVADATGRFPIEVHGSPGAVGQSHGEAPLVRIEVYP
ncbi:FtsP/CotA-like multicopper oxidase with cupredoxin domain [Nitrobacteraceae bacterium AZCC 1564]